MLPQRHAQATGLPQSGLYSPSLRIGVVVWAGPEPFLSAAAGNTRARGGGIQSTAGPAGVGCDTTLKGIQ